MEKKDPVGILNLCSNTGHQNRGGEGGGLRCGQKMGKISVQPRTFIMHACFDSIQLFM